MIDETVCKKPSPPEVFGVSNRDLEHFFRLKESVFGGSKMVAVPLYCTYTKYCKWKEEQ
jgi:hypothetical protein